MISADSVGLVTAVCRFVLNVRLLAVFFTIVWMQLVAQPSLVLAAALLGVALLTLAALLRWHHVARTLMRHPSFLAADLVLSLGILVVVGPESPFFYFTVGTAILAGVLYRWVGAAFFTVLLLAGYLWLVRVRMPLVDLPVTFQTLVGLPLLYPLAAAAGAQIRGLLDRLLATEHELAEQLRRTAVVNERSRFAREMHDSLAKTLHGIAFSARAIATWASRSPERAAADATKLAGIAEQAAAEAREMIGDLRADQLDASLASVIAAQVERWREDTALEASVSVDGNPDVVPEARYELLCILKEALRNVERHAHASTVAVHLSVDESTVRLRLNDDGVGAATPPDLEALAADGHYGLLGMAERAARVGGHLSFTTGALPGLCLEVHLPRSNHAEVPAARPWSRSQVVA